MKKFIATDIAEWICLNLEHLNQQNYHLVQAIKESQQANILNQAKKLLVLGRLVHLQKESIAKYLEITKVFAASDTATILLDAIDHAKTKAMPFSEYVLLLCELQKNYNEELLQEKKEVLLELPP